MSSGIKLTYEEVKLYFEQQGCTLLESDYKNARTKMRYRCLCGNESNIVFDSFRRGNRCRQCGNKKSKDKLKFTHEKIAAHFKEQGCELLEEYTANLAAMRYRCSCGKESTINWNNFRKGQRCKECGIKKRSKENHYLWYDDRDEFKLRCSFKDRCHKLITMVFNVTGRVKNEKTAKLLGYDYKTLQEHIKAHPNWEKIKDGKWHVDHIFPIKAFLDNGISDLKIINALDNLRPLDSQSNLSKNAKYDKQEFQKYLERKGVLSNANETSGDGLRTSPQTQSL